MGGVRAGEDRFWTRAAMLLLVVGALALTLVSCNPFRSQPIRNLPGVRAITGPVPPLFATAIMGLRAPQGIAVTPDGGRIYVAEGDGEREVKVIDLRTSAVIGALTPPKTEAGDRKPLSIAIGRNRIVYVVDRLRAVVDMYGQEGEWLGVLPDPPDSPKGWQPLGVGLGPDDRVYVTNAGADATALAAAEYDSAGRFLRTYRTSATDRAASLSFPTGVAARNADALFVVDSNNGRVVVVGNDGTILGAYGNEVGTEALAIPRGTVIDRRGYLYVTDVTSHLVKVWDVSQDPVQYLFSFGEPGSADGQLLYPNAVAADDRGTIYVADTGNDRVQVWRF